MLALPIPDHSQIMGVAIIAGWLGWFAVTGLALLFLRRSRRRLHDRRALLRARLCG
jgi:hypothetical protein